MPLLNSIGVPCSLNTPVAFVKQPSFRVLLYYCGRKKTPLFYPAVLLLLFLEVIFLKDALLTS